MASTYTTDLRIEKIATGEQSGTWGTTTNAQYDLWEDAIAGTSAITHDDTANYTLSANNGLADESRNMFLNIGGTLTAARNAVVPTVSKLYFVRNSTAGGFAVTVKTSAGTGISVANGDYMVLYCDGTNVVDAFNTVNVTGGTITGITDLAVADGGTGASTAGGALTNLGAAASGANSDITSLTGLTTPLSIAQGGTAAITASAARTALGLAIGSDVQAYNAGISSVPLEEGVHSIWIPAPAMTIPTTSGAPAGTVETTTNAVMLDTLDFDATADEYAQFAIRMPKSWNEGTVTAVFTWSHPATTTNFGVAWALQGVAFADGDAADTAYGTAVVVTDTGGTTDDIYITSATAAVTIAGTPAAEEWVSFRILRDVSDAGDTMAVDARLHGITVNITLDAGNDA